MRSCVGSLVRWGALLQADVRCRRVFRIWSRPLLQGSGLLSVDKRDSEPGPAVRIGASPVRRCGHHCAASIVNRAFEDKASGWSAKLHS